MDHTHIPQLRYIEVCRERNGSGFREELKPLWKWVSSVSFCVEIWAVGFFTSFTMETLLYLKVIRMKLLFLPSMTKLTLILECAAILIRCNEVLGMPFLTHILRVTEDRRLPSVVLPVVCVYAYVTLMVVFSVRTPNCLEMEYVEVHIWFKLFYQFYW